MNGSKDLYDFIMNKWGIKAQLFMLFEEQAELNYALLKTRRTSANFLIPMKQEITDIAGEIADNLIMLEQMTHYFNIEEEVELSMQYKLMRTAERSGFNDKAKDILPNDAVIEGDEE
jgi:NTP pyrophosphatase (non-canonical NTP hydrolase)